jgi:hypothetical protein
MRHIIAMLIVITLVGCAHGNTNLRERTAFWRAELARDIPTGTPQAKVKEWGITRNVRFDYLEKQRWFSANVELVPDSGIGFPCSHWNILLKIAIDANGRTVSSDVSVVGSCV